MEQRLHKRFAIIKRNNNNDDDDELNGKSKRERVWSEWLLWSKLCSDQSTGNGKTQQGLDAFLVPALKAGASAVRVLVQETHPAERLLASRTGVLLGLEMGLEVSSQVGLVGKASGAVIAGERLLSGVDPQVALEQPGSGEALAANVTLAGQSVRPYVHLQCWQWGVALVAKLAREVLLDLVGWVHLLVLDVTWLRWESLLALWAEKWFLWRFGWRRLGMKGLFVFRRKSLNIFGRRRWK